MRGRGKSTSNLACNRASVPPNKFNRIHRVLVSWRVIDWPGLQIVPLGGGHEDCMPVIRCSVLICYHSTLDNR